MTRGAQVLNDMWEKLKAERNDVVNEETFFWLCKALKALEHGDVLDMIKAELETNTEKWWYGENSGDCFVKLSYVLEIIDNCRKSVIEGVSE